MTKQVDHGQFCFKASPTRGEFIEVTWLIEGLAFRDDAHDARNIPTHLSSLQKCSDTVVLTEATIAMQ